METPNRRSILPILTIVLFAGISLTAIAATPAEIEQAIDDGISWLVSQQDPTGFWQGYGSTAGPTGIALIKLQERAFELGYTPFDPCYPYSENVEKGLAYLFSNMNIISTPNQPAGNPDTDGDGKGVYVSTGYPIYETGIVMMAIAASKAPNMEVNSPGSPVDGWTYKEVLQDMVDYMAFGQCDSGIGRGGWRYSPNSGADNSCSGFAVSGLGYAESPRYGFNCTIPQFVKEELKIWIDYIQIDGGDDDGGSGYTSPYDGANILRTGNLIFEMTFAGIPVEDPNVQRALSYISRNWDYGWSGDCQTMYCTANGLWYSQINTIVVDGNERDWYADFVDNLVDIQQSTGYWSSGYGYILDTEWALLALERPASYVDLEKTDNVDYGDCVGPGDFINYTIDYNYPAGPNLPDYNDVNIIDYLPPEVDFNSADSNGIYDPCSNTVTWEIGTLSPGTSDSKTLKVLVKCALPGGVITNKCKMKSGEQVLNTAYENTPVCGPPTLTKVDDVNSCAGPGDYITYHLCYAANGYGDTNVIITDELPPDVDFVSATGDYELISGTVTWDIGTLGPDDSNCLELIIQVKCATPGSTITNCCEMSGDCLTSPITSCENTSVCGLPTLTKVDDVNGCVGPGDYINYNICYAAHGYGDTNVIITDELPPELGFISASGNYSQPDSNTVIWSIGTLEPNESNCVTLTVKVKCAAPAGTITNCCEMTGDCIDINDCENTPVCGPPTITKEDNVPDGNCVGPGDEIVYNICYAANGYGDTNVIITDELTDDLEFVSATGDYEFVSGMVTWDIGTLGPDESGCVTLTVVVKNSVELCTSITNLCEMTGDCITTAVVASEHTSVCCPELTKVDDVNSCVQTDDTIIYNICYAANGCSDTSVIIVDFLPNEVNYITSDPCGLNDPCSGTVTWDIGTLEDDDSGCLELVVQVNTSAKPETRIQNHCLMTGDHISGIYAQKSAVVGLPGTYACEVMADGPVLYIRFEEDDPYDWSGNDYWVEADPRVVIEKTAGSLGKAAYLNYGYVAAANQQTEPNLPTQYGHQYAFAPNEITFEFWLYTPQPDSMFVYTQLFSQAESIFSGGGNSGTDQGVYAPEATLCDAISGEQKCRMSFGYDRIPPDDSIGNFAYTSEGAWAIDKNWHQYVFIWDPLGDPNRINVKCYRDAIKYKDDTYGPPDRPDVPVLGYIGPEMDHLLIGGLGSRDTWDESIVGSDCSSSWYKNYWQYIDEFAIYPEVLDPNRIKAHYDAWWAWAKDCKELWDRGLVGMQPGIDPIYAVIDLNQDCKIDFYDFAIFAEEWALCNDPAEGQGCVPNW